MCDIDPPSKARGRSLLSVETREQSEYLTEYHGLTSGVITSLVEDGHPRSVVEPYDTELFGLATGAYYCYETVERFNEGGSPPTANPREKMSEHIEELDRRAVDATETRLCCRAKPAQGSGVICEQAARIDTVRYRTDLPEGRRSGEGGTHGN